MTSVVWFGMALAALLTISGCEPAEKTPLPSHTPPSIHGEIIEVQEMVFPLHTEATGVVTAKTKAFLASKIPGLVNEVRGREGDRVARNQVLVILEGRDLQAEAAQAEAELENAKIQLARMERLHAEDSVAQQELDNARRNFRVARARKEATQARLSYTSIKAPFAGLITERLIEPGEVTSPGQPLLKIEDPSSLQLEVTVSESDVQTLRQGDMLMVTIDALTRTRPTGHLSGTITNIVPTGDPATHTVLVKVGLPTVSGLRSGMFGRAVFAREQIKTLAVPQESLVLRDDLSGVFVIDDNQVAHLRWIKTGRRFDGNVEVLSGLAGGERILASARHGVDEATVIPTSDNRTSSIRPSIVVFS